jgi:hypothetical protein
MHKGKPRIIVGNGSLYRVPKPNRLINHPTNGTPKFCDFPAVRARGKQFSGGPIYLREGMHKGKNWGFGFRHIWAEHFKEETDPIAAERTVVGFVAQILTAGSAIFYEGGTGSLADRACVLRSAEGVVIVEERLNRSRPAIYSVVTAIPAGRPYGTQIGVLPVPAIACLPDRSSAAQSPTPLADSSAPPANSSTTPPVDPAKATPTTTTITTASPPSSAPTTPRPNSRRPTLSLPGRAKAQN